MLPWPVRPLISNRRAMSARLSPFLKLPPPPVFLPKRKLNRPTADLGTVCWYSGAGRLTATRRPELDTCSVPRNGGRGSEGQRLWDGPEGPSYTRRRASRSSRNARPDRHARGGGRVGLCPARPDAGHSAAGNVSRDLAVVDDPGDFGPQVLAVHHPVHEPVL